MNDRLEDMVCDVGEEGVISHGHQMEGLQGKAHTFICVQRQTT